MGKNYSAERTVGPIDRNSYHHHHCHHRKITNKARLFRNSFTKEREKQLLLI